MFVCVSVCLRVRAYVCVRRTDIQGTGDYRQQRPVRAPWRPVITHPYCKTNTDCLIYHLLLFPSLPLLISLLIGTPHPGLSPPIPSPSFSSTPQHSKKSPSRRAKRESQYNTFFLSSRLTQLTSQRRLSKTSVTRQGRNT